MYILQHQVKYIYFLQCQVIYALSSTISILSNICLVLSSISCNIFYLLVYLCSGLQETSWSMVETFSAMVHLLSGVTTLENYYCSRYKYMINNECNKGEKDEKVFSGSADIIEI